MKTLYISDLDGTLLNTSAELSDGTVNALNKMIADGVNFSIATARTYASAIKLLSKLNLHTPIVLMNGVQIYDMEQKSFVNTHYLKEDTVSSIIKVLHSHDMSAMMYEFKNDELRTYYEHLEHK
ncbi:MAG: Cof-type HAD-IIB family hydrolase, partial [Streptococcaceae bacterium]|nr:Cof-type HAD-IIB family hydrolase [Streptococcaceae bacterium]